MRLLCSSLVFSDILDIGKLQMYYGIGPHQYKYGIHYNISNG